ncbi:hypothetical protein BX600DRAFT_514772 [Xylariales sp. PMI_506]|nr:hypothetical protein BX600DRAFT_514772 [Xylariales sp. PMI_506]
MAETDLSVPVQSLLFQHLAGDIAAATISAALVTPTVAIIDRAVVEKVVYHEPFLQSLKAQAKSAVRKPRHFLFCRPFGIIWTLYAATYTVASCSDTISRWYADQTTASTVTFLATTAVNVPLGIWKDVRFAQIYSHMAKCSSSSASPSQALEKFAKKNVAAAATTTPQPPAPPVTQPVPTPISPKVPKGLPKLATAAFLGRDIITIFGSFTLAPEAARFVPESLVPEPHIRATIAQLVVPTATQLLATPIHLLGLDLYHRQQADPALTLAGRLRHIRRGLGEATIVRCIRILPAFGVGVLVNTELRSFFQYRFTLIAP